jgi:ribonuclease HI
MRIFILLLAAVILMFPAETHALEGLTRLQSLAMGDQATECMVHEYTRRYNEVLRDFSKRQKQLTDEMEDKAHEEALSWVRSVWAKTDSSVVEKNIKSNGFQSAIKKFRHAKKDQYPKLAIVR